MKSKDLYISSKFIVVIAALWFLLFALTVSESLFFYQINDQPAPYRSIIVNDLFMLCWAPISPILFIIIRTWYLKKTKWLSFILKTLALGALAIAVIIGMESIIHYVDLMNTEKERTLSNIYLQLISFRFNTNLILYLGFAAISVAVMAYFEAKRSEEQRIELSRSLIEAQLGVLKAQMKPHFLFNSLHAISGLILKKQNETAITVIAKLSDLLRESLSMDEKKWIPIEEEIEFINRYLEIYVLRFGEQLTYSIDVEEQKRSVLIPPAILQPIVENSLVHGIVPNDNQGHISIEVFGQDQSLCIQITDNGSNFLGQEKTDVEGLGLKNTRKRLSSLYQDQFEFSSQINSDGGYTSKIVVPISPR
ncbi:MAG: histidine kinase [Reichenbachiella sp.]|uniref:sensor histidine kinase n=1 Tax=Reichenbachiella sp. TaxID=2184521 RepID=UPI003266E605